MHVVCNQCETKTQKFCFQAIDELLVYGNDVSLPLSHGVGSALCAATNTAYEYRRPMSGRIQLVSLPCKYAGKSPLWCLFNSQSFLRLL